MSLGYPWLVVGWFGSTEKNYFFPFLNDQERNIKKFFFIVVVAVVVVGVVFVVDVVDVAVVGVVIVGVVVVDIDVVVVVDWLQIMCKQIKIT